MRRSDAGSYHPVARLLLAVAACAAAIAALHYVAPGLASTLGDYPMRMLMLSGISIILAVSLNLINGFAGQFSLGHAGFYAIGAYCSAVPTHYWGDQIISRLEASLHFPEALAITILMVLAVLIGMVTAGIAGLLVGLPSLRLRGDYLAIATLGFGEAIRVILGNMKAVGAQTGFTVIPSYATYTTFTWVFGLVFLILVFSRNLAMSSHGRALFAIRDDEAAAESAGVDVFRYKVLAFALGAGWAGVAGALFAHYDGFLAPESFDFMKSIDIVVMVVLGGGGSITGCTLAAVVLTALPETLRGLQNYRMALYSLALIVLMLTRPQGIFGRSELSPVGFYHKLSHRLRRRPITPVVHDHRREDRQ